MDHEFHVALVADLLGSNGEVVFKDFGIELLDEAGVSHAFLAEDRSPVTPDQLADFDVVISMGQAYTRDSLTGLDRLALIARTGVGYDMIDLDVATDADVMVTITPEATRKPVASATLALMLGLCHRVTIKDAIVRNDNWDIRFDHMGCEIRGRTVGLIGMGMIGREVVRLLAPFEPSEILVSDPAVTEEEAARLGVTLADLETLLKRSTFVSIHCPLNEHTRYLVGSRELRMMRPDAFVINTARGAIIDQEALNRALREGWISGAAIDVFEQEPPNSADELLSLPNVILAPHASAWTHELFRDIGHDCMKAALAVSRGEEPPYVVNRAVLERPGLRKKLEKFRS
jgi:phosphoglycerate dehydrogenase-like enzyme